MLTVVPASEQREYSPSLPVYDVRDYSGDTPGIHALGGLPGELIISLQAFRDNLMASGMGNGAEIRADTIMKFLEELFADGFPVGACFIRLTKDPLSEEEKVGTYEKQAELAA